MAQQLGKIWQLDPHTRAKHDILRRYWQAWLPIMARTNQRVLYIDGFSGPGRYAGGEDGSPLIVLNAAYQHKARPKSEVVFVFIEKDRKRFEHLSETIEQMLPTLPPNFKVHCMQGEFDEKMSAVFRDLDDQRNKLAPSLVFVDPFGFSQTPFATIKRIVNYPKCEILVTFMYEEINRFLSHPDHAETYNQLFGTDRWKNILGLNESDKRLRAIHDIYRDQLRNAGAEFVRSFRMLNRGNRTDYFLFFATSNLKGLEKMKEAMWSADPSGTFAFSDYTDSTKTMNLFPNEPDFAKLKDMILERFGDSRVSVEGLGNFVIAETPFLRTHFKTQILKPMEKSGELSVATSKRGRKFGTFPEGTMLVFSGTKKS